MLFRSRSGRSDEILIWGNILPYKGVLEFISSPAVRVAGLNVRIVGRCKDPGMAKDIEKAVAECDSAEFVGSYSNGSESLRSKIIFENRAADFDELASLVSSSKFVLFPYLPGSVSSSGVLMDTLAMGGNPVGPAVGAFADLSRENVCFVYGSEAEMIEILVADEAVVLGFVQAEATSPRLDAGQETVPGFRQARSRTRNGSGCNSWSSCCGSGSSAKTRRCMRSPGPSAGAGQGWPVTTGRWRRSC